jgi:hypothetical protein
MVGRDAGRTPVARAGLALDHAELFHLDDLLDRAEWFRPVRGASRLKPGAVVKDVVAVPERAAQAALREVTRLVADLPLDTSPVVVWAADGSELGVDTAGVRVACRDGIVTVTVPVRCDELHEWVPLAVPFAVGRRNSPTGLVMSTFTRLDGPELLTARWSDAVTAFAWESLLELARRLTARLGSDSSGRPLVPGGIAAASGVLLLQPMARHDARLPSRSDAGPR